MFMSNMPRWSLPLCSARSDLQRTRSGRIEDQGDRGAKIIERASITLCASFGTVGTVRSDWGPQKLPLRLSQPAA